MTLLDKRFSMLYLSVWVIPLVTLLSKPYLGHYFVPHDVLAGLSTLFLIIFSFRFIQYGKTDNLFLCAWLLTAVSHILFAFVQTFFFDNSEYMALRGALGHGFKIILIIVAIPLIKQGYNYFLWNLNFINVVIVSMSVFLFIMLVNGVDIHQWQLPQRPDISFFYLWNENFVLGATNVIRKYGDITVIRIAGFSNEPGTLALIITYLLVLNEFTYKSMWLRGIYLIAGAMTFSLAFVVSLMFFVFYWFVESKQKRAYIILLLSIIIILPTAYNFIPQSGVKTFINTKFLARFEYDPNTKTIKGDNRTRSIMKSNAVYEFQQNPFWGVGALEAKKRGASGANIMGELARYGVFGIILFYLPFYILALRFWADSKIILIFVLFINFFQRPGMHEMFTMLMITSLYYTDCYKKFENNVFMFPCREKCMATINLMKILFFLDVHRENKYAR